MLTGMKDAFLKYAAQDVPRYTSYPTAAQFKSGLGPADFARMAAPLTRADPVSLYVHVPFCRQLCWYCGCHTNVLNDVRRLQRYTEQLAREAALVKASATLGRVRFLHFGGGTPSLLDPVSFVRFVAEIDRLFGIASDAEIAIEGDPRGLDALTVAGFRAAGVNRVSLGVQDFDLEVQKAVNRVQPFEQVAECVELLRRNGIEAINFDLMYGLPKQTIASAERSARLAASLVPARVAVFGYAHVPWFKAHQQLIQDADLPDLHARSAQAEASEAALTDAGYMVIGLDHYARPGDRLALAAADGALRRNFQGYTTDTQKALIGLGASAISALPGGFIQNERRTGAWAAAIEAGQLTMDRGIALNAEDRYRAEAIEAMMCTGRVDVARILKRHGAPLTALDDALGEAQRLAADGLCTVEGRVVVVRPEARRLLRTVAAVFDATRSAPGRRHAKAV